METKVCCRCGVEKPLDQFRKYYHGRRGAYKYCLICEKLELRRRYLVGLQTLSDDQRGELESINRLYELRAARGLSVPSDDSARKPIGVKHLVDAELQRYSADEQHK